MTAAKKDVKAAVSERPTLKTLASAAGVDRGRIQKIHAMFYGHGPGKGTFLSLPFDQLVEHGAVHRLKGRPEDRIADPRTVIELANRGDFSCLVLHIGLAEKYQHDMNPDVPLLVKLDGHFTVGKEADAPTPGMFSTLERAMRVGATAVGLTFYLGSVETREDMERIGDVIERAHDYGLPVVVWSYPRGPLVNKTQADSLYWVHHAVQAGESLGVDIVKTKFPSAVKEKSRGDYGAWVKEVGTKIKEGSMYMDLEPAPGKELTYEQHVQRMKMVVDAAPRTLVVVSGGPKVADAEKALMETTRIVMDAGAEGRIIGRNFWGIPVEEGLRLSGKVAAVMTEPQYAREL